MQVLKPQHVEVRIYTHPKWTQIQKSCHFELRVKIRRATTDRNRWRVTSKYFGKAFFSAPAWTLDFKRTLFTEEFPRQQQRQLSGLGRSQRPLQRERAAEPGENPSQSYGISTCWKDRRRQKFFLCSLVPIRCLRARDCTMTGTRLGARRELWAGIILGPFISQRLTSSIPSVTGLNQVSCHSRGNCAYSFG